MAELARTRGDARFIAGAVVACVLLRFPALMWPLTSDEAGFLLVARSWDPAADSLYGPHWVDRSPVLIGLFRAMDELAGAYGPRLASAVLAVLFVLAAYRIGQLVAGRAAARWVSVAAVAFITQPDLTVWAAKSESLGVPLVLVSCWLALEAYYRQAIRTRLLFAFASGVAGALAVAMKQNLIGGAVFGVVLLVVAGSRRDVPARLVRRLGAAAAAGFAVPVLAVVAWTAAVGVRPSLLWDMLYGFRTDAYAVIRAHDMSAPMERASELVQIVIATGMLLVIIWFAGSLRLAVGRRPALAYAVAAMLSVEAVTLCFSGSYWDSNLIGLLPGVVLSLVLLADLPGGRAEGTRLLVLFAAGATLHSLLVLTTDRLDGTEAPAGYYAGQAIGRTARAGDTILVLYGRAEIVEASGLAAPYRHLWSLPLRTLDPDLARMRTLLRSPDRPTWVVEWVDPNAWNIDASGRLRSVLRAEYRVVGELCGRPIHLRADARRPPLPDIDCGAPWVQPPWA